MQVLGTHVVVDAVVPALQQCPEAFDPVRVGHVVHELTGRVADGLVIVANCGKVLVALEVVRHD